MCFYAPNASSSLTKKDHKFDVDMISVLNPLLNTLSFFVEVCCVVTGYYTSFEFFNLSFVKTREFFFEPFGFTCDLSFHLSVFYPFIRPCFNPPSCIRILLLVRICIFRHDNHRSVSLYITMVTRQGTFCTY